MTGIKERLLLYKIKVKKDPNAFAEFYDLNVAKIYRFVFFKISHKEEAEDLTANVFFKAWDYLNESDQEIKNLNALLYSIARNLIVDWYRNKAKRQEYEVDSTLDYVDKNDLEQAIGAKTEAEKLVKIIKTLKQDYQEVLLLRLIEGMSLGEVAQITNRSQVSARVTLHRAMKKLREMIDINH